MAMQKGDSVSIKNENSKRVGGIVHSYGQANDGTGRYGYFVEAEPGTLYWRLPAEVRRVR